MPPSTKLLNRKPTQTKVVAGVVAAGLQGAAVAAPGPWSLILTAVAWLITGGAFIKRPGDW